MPFSFSQTAHCSISQFCPENFLCEIISPASVPHPICPQPHSQKTFQLWSGWPAVVHNPSSAKERSVQVCWYNKRTVWSGMMLTTWQLLFWKGGHIFFFFYLSELIMWWCNAVPQPTWDLLQITSILLWPMYPSSNCCFQQANAPCPQAQIISHRFHEHDDEFSVV